MAISIEEIVYKNMENALGSQCTVDVVVTVDVRIIRFGFTGKENMFAKSHRQPSC